jgi:hypothetical protein
MRRVAEPQPGIGLRITNKEEESSHRRVVVQLEETRESVTTRSLEHRPGRTYVELSIAREVAFERYFSLSGLEVSLWQRSCRNGQSSPAGGQLWLLCLYCSVGMPKVLAASRDAAENNSPNLARVNLFYQST